MPSYSKVFGIGLSRTGTTSLHLALRILGFRSFHYPRLDSISDILRTHDAAVDTPIAYRFRELDASYPGSRFILTVRDIESWLVSTRHHFSASIPDEQWKRDLRLKTYGIIHWDADVFRDAYYRHLNVVKEHFKTRPDKLLIMNIVEGDSWDVLCPFLEVPIPSNRFPHGAARMSANSQQSKSTQEARELIPRMSAAEEKLFTSLLEQSQCYLEYGAGASTLMAVQSAVQRIVSIDSDITWIDSLKENNAIASAVAKKRLMFRYIDVGPIRAWGAPIGEDKIRNWPQYALDPFLATDFDFDTILVDGRFRIHCLLAIVNCASLRARVFLRDYGFRHEYTIADKYFDTIERVESTALLKIRGEINRRSLYIDLISYLFAP